MKLCKTYHQPLICFCSSNEFLYLFCLTFKYTHESHTQIWQQPELEEGKWHLKQCAFVPQLHPLSCRTDVCKSTEKVCTHACVYFWADFLTITEMSLNTRARTSVIKEQQVTKTSGKGRLQSLWKLLFWHLFSEIRVRIDAQFEYSAPHITNSFSSA